MKLPNGDRAIVDIRKLRAYCLNLHHARGRNKARVFASVGIRETDAEELRAALLAPPPEPKHGWELRTYMDGVMSSISNWLATAELLESAAHGSFLQVRSCRG